jgi:hypothetical protein
MNILQSIRRAIRSPIIRFLAGDDRTQLIADLAGDDLVIVGDVYGSTTGPAPVFVPANHNVLAIGNLDTHDGPAVIVPRGCTPPAPTIPADRLALAMCSWRPVTCTSPCALCRAQSAAVAHELAAILRERHGSSATADWLDGVGCHA